METTIVHWGYIKVYRDIVPLKQIEYGFGHFTIRFPYIAYSIYLRGTIGLTEYRVQGV